MRLWSLHPSLLDRQGLTAVWRESLLAQAVLAGRTRGYQHHPQLERFRATEDALGAVAAYLDAVQQEATRRGYRYDAGRIDPVSRWAGSMAVPEGQVALELEHLRRKLAARSPDRVPGLPTSSPPLHPMMHVVPGGIEAWERAVIETDGHTSIIMRM